MPPQLPDDPRLQAYLDGELSADEAAVLGDELAADPALAKALERLRRLNQLVAESGNPDLPAGFLDRLETHMQNSTAHRRGWFPAPGWAPAPAAALSLALTVVLALVIFPPGTAKLAAGGGAVHDLAETVTPTAELAPSEGAVTRAAGESFVAESEAPSSAPVEAALAEPATTSPAAPPRRVGLTERGRTKDLAGTATVFQEPSDEPLRAGEVDDNARIETYRTYLAKVADLPEVSHYTTAVRYLVEVVDAKGVAVPDAEVRLAAGQQSRVARTDSSGRVGFFPGVLGLAEQPAQVIAEKDGQRSQVADIAGGADQTVRLTIPLRAWTAPARMPLDVMFIVDTTGSMAEEIDRLRETIRDVADRIGRLEAAPDLRLGLLLYRDQGDDYVTRLYPFRETVAEFSDDLRDVTANGGGDAPEDVEAALADAAQRADWRAPTALRLAFLIADAPPHLDYPNSTPYVQSARRLAERGVKVFAVSTSGMDDTGEFVWRQLALLTRGTFLFITKGGSVGYTPHHVDRQEYTVQALPDLVVRCVARELAALGHPPGTTVEVTLPESRLQPDQVAPRPEPVEIHAPDHPGPNPLRPVGYLLVLIAHFAGWYHALRRSRTPLPSQRDVDASRRWTPPVD